MKDLIRLVIKLLLVLYVSVGCLSQTARLNQDEMKDLREESLNDTSSGVGSPTKSPSSEEEREQNGEDDTPSNHARIPHSDEETEPEDDASSHLTASSFLLVTCLTVYATTSLSPKYV